MPQRTVTVVVLLALMAVAFAFHYGTALKFAGTGALEGIDLILEADTDGRLRCFKYGSGGYGQSVSHPNVCGIVKPPVRVFTKIITVVFGTDYKSTHTAVGLAVSPLAASISSGLLFLIALELGLGLVVAGLIGALLSVSFSQVIFGSVPEFYALGGMSISLALYVSAISVRREIRPWVWMLVAILAGSITITNLAIVLGIAWITFVCRGSLSERWFSSSVLVTKIGAVAVALTALSALMTSIVWERPLFPSSSSRANPVVAFEAHREKHMLTKAFSFPRAIGNSILPNQGAIQWVLHEPGDHWLETDLKWLEESKIKHVSQMPDNPEILSRALLVFLAIVGGLILPLVRQQQGSLRRQLALCAIFVFLFNFLLHSIWGQFLFLYSQHWLPASILAISFLLTYSTHRLRVAMAAFFTLAVLIINLSHLNFILSGLA